MSNHDRLSRRDAERLLDGSAATSHDLDPVLDAVRAPARAGELRGEDAMVAAFHAARLATPPATRIGFVAPSQRRRAALRAVVATGAVVAVTSSGLALAATGHLPSLPELPALPGQGSGTTNAPQTQHTSPAASPTAPETTQAPSLGTSSTDPSEGTGHPRSAPSPGLRGLCQAFQATDRADRGKALESGAFRALTAAAGGRAAVATYCVTLVGEAQASPTKPVKPTHGVTPTHPVKPTKPPKPPEPTHPTKPPKPTTPPKPTKSDHPTKPPKPTKSADPTQPPKPTKSADPTTPPKPTKAATPTPEVGPTDGASPPRPSTSDQQPGKPEGVGNR